MDIEKLPINPLKEDELLELPEIKLGDAILVYYKENDKKKHDIFCSDGRVAQSDADIDRNWVKYIDIPREKIPTYGPRLIIDEALRRGHLKELFDIFGDPRIIRGS